MLISTKQRAQSIQLLADTEITAINSAFSNRSSSPRSCSSTSSNMSTNSDKTSTDSAMPEVSPESSTATDSATVAGNATVDTNSLTNIKSASDSAPASNETTKNLQTNEIDQEAANATGTKLNETIDEIYEYWKNFEIQKLKNDLNEQIGDILQCQVQHKNLNDKYAELNQELSNQVSNEEILKAVSPYLKAFQLDLDQFTDHCKTTETRRLDLLKFLTNVPDPFPVIELVRQCDDFEQVAKLKTENKDLKEALNAYRNEISLMTNQESKQSEDDKDLILHLSEQVGITTSLNLELTSRLKLAEGEIESYKKILVDYQNEISEMKVKHLNEIKSDYHKESDKLKKIDSQSISESSIKSTTASLSTAALNNGINNSNTNNKSDKLTTSEQTTSLIKSNNNTSKTPSAEASPISTMTTSTNKWINSLNAPRTDRLALLQSLTALSNAIPNHASAASATLKTLLNKSADNTPKPADTQFKPIFKIKTEEANNNDPADDSATENEFDDTEALSSDTTQIKCASPVAAGGTYEPINTADIAQKVRDLLSVHNIGQRVFAKFILGLSQGTVSELLSKPKHWDKLTEKGRESYRKMYNWSCSETSINTLKAISPRKGNKDNYFYQNGSGKEDSATEDRINQILSEAQRQMQSKRALSGSPSPSGSSAISPSNTGSPSMSPTSTFLASAHANGLYNSTPQTNQTYEHDDESMNEEEDQEDTVRTQMRQQQNKRSSNEHDSYPLDLTVRTNPQANHHHHHHQNHHQNHHQHHHRNFHTKKIKIEQQEEDQQQHQRTAQNRTPMSAVSPLKHIQSIADAYLINQLESQSQYNKMQSPTNSNSFQRPSSTPSPSLSAHGNQQTSTKTLKCILPPVSQEQFDRYSFINTEELVKKVKDLLSKFSISQRLFGECILGLSQGSVSDLLARPKPWQMLTQKGREPFIRMQMFIDDPDAIKKLMANQYKPPTDKASRNTSLINTPPVTSTPLHFDTKDQLSKIISQSTSLFNQTQAQSLSQMFNAISHTQNLLNLSQQQHQQHTNNNSNNNNNNDNSNDSELLKTGSNSFQPQINIIPYDISTMSAVGDLNTEEITNRVKETLLNNNIGQKLFGEAVLNLSQGTVSELLSKPKPWNTLSIKGREPYLRMYMWLNDLGRLEKLNEWKEEKNLLKRNSTEVESDHQKPKRRFIFSEEQKDQLMRAFKYDPYPAVNQMEALATKLNLQTRTVINWFHNHRMRIRYKSSTGQQQSQLESPGHSRSRSSNQNSFDEFTKSLQTLTSGGCSGGAGSRSVNVKLEQRFGGPNAFQAEQRRNGNGASTPANNSFFNYSNGNDGETMNDDEDGAYDDDDDFNEANLDNDENNEPDTRDEDEPRTKAALALLNNAYNLPGYFKHHQQQSNYENDRKNNEDEDDENDLHDSSIQDDLDTDPEAEINSMYIPGDDNNGHNENEDEYYEHSGSSSAQHIYNQQSPDNEKSKNSQQKRRKPHNPQKLSFALNLLNSKLQQKQLQQRESGDSEQDVAQE